MTHKGWYAIKQRNRNQRNQIDHYTLKILIQSSFNKSDRIHKENILPLLNYKVAVYIIWKVV